MTQIGDGWCFSWSGDPVKTKLVDRLKTVYLVRQKKAKSLVVVDLWEGAWFGPMLYGRQDTSVNDDDMQAMAKLSNISAIYDTPPNEKMNSQ